MHLYAGTSTDFVEDATRNKIANKLEIAFRSHFRYAPSQAEIRSWRASLAAMSRVIDIGGLGDHGVICEYRLPLTSRRLDVMVTGHADDGRPTASIVELKQWDHAGPSDVDELVTTFVGGGEREVLHPSVQVGQYRQYILDTHEAFTEGGVGLRASAYLHNFMYDDQSELYAPRHASALQVNPLFAGDQVDELADWLRTWLDGGNGVPVMRTVLEGRYRPSKRLLDHTADMIDGHPAYVLLDEQKVAFNAILARVHDSIRTDTKSVFLVRGGPGTGKSVVAVKLVGELAKAGVVTHHATGSKAFTENLRKAVGSRASALFKYFNSCLGEEPNSIDVVVCDEAHRIREVSHSRFTKREDRTNQPQVDELIDAARSSVFFIDDLQTVRPGEIGSSQLIRQAASTTGAQFYEFELEAQFRCGGSDEYVEWVANTLELDRTASVMLDPTVEFDFDVVDSPRELQALINQRANEGHSARLVAGFCWPWSDPRSDGSLVDDVVIGDFAMPWNAKPDKRVTKGIPRASHWANEEGGLEQVGCIYTAQGFEFDFAGVIFGRDLVYRPREGWVGQPEFSHDRPVRGAAKSSIEEFTRLVKQTYRVLLTRGLKGCYVYFEDEATRDFVLSRIERVRTAERIGTDEPLSPERVE